MSEDKEHQRRKVYLSKSAYLVIFSLIILLDFVTWFVYGFSGRDLVGVFNILVFVLIIFFMLTYDVKKQNKTEIDKNE